MINWWNKFGYVPIYKKGKIPDPENLELAEGSEEISEDFSEDELHKMLDSKDLSRDVKKGLLLIPGALIEDSYIQDLERDLGMLKELRTQWFKAGKIESDPKNLRKTPRIER